MGVIATAILVSCTAQGPKPTLKTDIDSLSYATGLAQTDGLKMYLIHQAGVDTAYMGEFLKGFNEGARLTGAKDVAYLEGQKIGQMVAKNWVQGMNQQIFNGDSAKTITKSDLLAGFIAGVRNDTTRMTLQFAQVYRQSATEKKKIS